MSMILSEVCVDGGRRVVYGTNDGVYFSRLRDTRDSVKVLNLPDITQVDILEDYQLLIVLSGEYLPKLCIYNLF